MTVIQGKGKGKVKKNVFVALTIGFILAICLYFVQTTYATVSAEKEIEVVLQSYFKALENGDIEAQIMYSDDLRFKDENDHRKFLEKIQTMDKIKNIKLDSLEMIDASTAQAYVTIQSKLSEKVGKTELKQVFEVVNKDEQWTVIVGQDYK